MSELDDDDILTMSVPVGVASLYLVATSGAPADPHGAAVAVAAELPVAVRRSAELMLSEDWLTVETLPATPGSVPLPLLAAYGASAEQRDTIEAATQLLRVRGLGRAWGQPYHEWAARAVAAGLAELQGADVIDMFTPRILTVAEARRSLPDEYGDTPLAAWVRVVVARQEGTLRLSTRGLSRYGLPELQLLDVPDQVKEAWTGALYGVAQRLLDEWSEALRTDDRPSFVDLPAEFLVAETDVARAVGAAPDSAGPEAHGLRVRLRLDPPEDPDGDALLTIGAPGEGPWTAATFITEAPLAVFGPRDDTVDRIKRDDAMEAAIGTARAELPQARSRLLTGAIEPDAHLVVKHLVSVDGSDPEFVWAIITAWPEPDLLVGTSMNTAGTNPAVRVGQPVRVSADAVADWAIYRDGVGVVYGGWTNTLIDS